MWRDRKRDGGMVSAAEIGAYVYCPEAWRLQYGLGLEPGNQTVREAGDRHHARKALAERIAGLAIASGRMLAVLTILALLLWWVLSR